MDRVFLMTDGGPGGVTEIVGTYIYGAFSSPGANLGKVSAIGILIMIIAFSIGFVQIRLRLRQD